MTIQSQSNQTASDQGSRTHISNVATVSVTGSQNTGVPTARGPNPGTLQLLAGNDINLNAAHLSNQSGGATQIQAGHDLNLGTVTETQSQTNHFATGDAATKSLDEIGSSIQSSGDILLSVGQNINIKGGQVESTLGSLSAEAGNDINIVESRSEREITSKFTQKYGNALTKHQDTEQIALKDNLANGTSLSAQEINLIAGNNLTLQGTRLRCRASETSC